MFDIRKVFNLVRSRKTSSARKKSAGKSRKHTKRKSTGTGSRKTGSKPMFGFFNHAGPRKQTVDKKSSAKRKTMTMHEHGKGSDVSVNLEKPVPKPFFAEFYSRKKRTKRPSGKISLKETTRELVSSDIMTRKVVSILKDDTLSYVVRLYVDKNISGSPVVTKSGMLVGTLSETDITQFVGSKDLIDARANRLDVLKDTRVEEIMKRNIITVREQTPIHEVNYLMNKYDIARVFVVDEKRQVIGIVTRADVVRGISKEMTSRMAEKEREIEKTELETAVDKILELVDRKGSVSVDQVSKLTGLSVTKVDEWGQVLEKHKLIEVQYPPVGRPIFKKRVR